MSPNLFTIPNKSVKFANQKSLDGAISPSRFKKQNLELFAKKRKPLFVSEDTKDEFNLTESDVKLMKHHNIIRQS